MILNIKRFALNFNKFVNMVNLLLMTKTTIVWINSIPFMNDV